MKRRHHLAEKDVDFVREAAALVARAARKLDNAVTKYPAHAEKLKRDADDLRAFERHLQERAWAVLP